MVDHPGGRTRATPPEGRGKNVFPSAREGWHRQVTGRERRSVKGAGRDASARNARHLFGREKIEVAAAVGLRHRPQEELAIAAAVFGARGRRFPFFPPRL